METGLWIILVQPAEETGAGAKAMIDDGLMTLEAVATVHRIQNLVERPSLICFIRIGSCANSYDLRVGCRLIKGLLISANDSIVGHRILHV